ncbi:MAG: hypothetical protein AB1758_02590 [Candidatus Eremiobacterota bacterium]
MLESSSELDRLQRERNRIRQELQGDDSPALRRELARTELAIARLKASRRTDASEEWYWSAERDQASAG